MDFELTSDQKLLQDAVQRFVAGEYAFDSRQRILASAHGFSDSIWQRLAAQGVLALGLPEDYGGFGGPIEIMVVMEQLGAGLVLEPFLSTVVLGAGLIARHGSPAQKSWVLPRVIDGSIRIALAHYEPDARYVLDRVDARARMSDGRFLLSGRKSVVLDGATAELLIVSAREESSGAVSLFLVDPSAAGIKLTRYRTQDGRNAADIELAELSLGAEHLLGVRGAALVALEEALDHALAALCAEAVGIMEAVNRATLDYLRTRVQFGQPIGRFQVLQHRMADMFMMAVQARSMSLLASGRCAVGDARQRHHDVCAAKAFVGKAARFIGQQSVQLHGGMGMSAELIVSHYFKRLTMINATFGDCDHHLGIISDHILRERA